MANKRLGLDERSQTILGRICALLYLVTIYFLLGDVLYRQFVLHQTPEQFEDIAALLTGNVFVFIALLLYFGGVTFGRLSFGKLFVGYLAFLIIGLAVTTLKYWGQSTEFLLGKAVIVFSLCTLIAALTALVGFLGNRKIEQALEEEPD